MDTSKYIEGLSKYIVQSTGYVTEDLQDLRKLRSALEEKNYTCEFITGVELDIGVEFSDNPKAYLQKLVELPIFLFIEYFDRDVNERGNRIIHYIVSQRVKIGRPTFVHLYKSTLKEAKEEFSALAFLEDYFLT
ncbi:MAG: hypothetical protein AAF740_09820 [Bacteroidota bacterium]